MKKIVISACALALMAVSACGVDGEPTTPEPKQKTGISVTGRAEIGVRKTS